MGKKKLNEEFFPEMSEILEGMQELMCDEDGNPLSPDHPQYKKFTGLMENIAERAQKKNQEHTSIPGHQGTA
jgi:hypothetical protein